MAECADFTVVAWREGEGKGEVTGGCTPNSVLAPKTLLQASVGLILTGCP